MTIRSALPHECQRLTEISFASKKYWDYPLEYFTIWQDELTITPSYLECNTVYVFETDKTVTGYYSLVELKEELQLANMTLAAGLWLEHMFIHPSFIGKGMGKDLFQHCIQVCSTLNFPEIKILSDPHAKGFYLKMGCLYIQEYPSSIAGRTTPYLKHPL